MTVELYYCGSAKSTVFHIVLGMCFQRIPKCLNQVEEGGADFENSFKQFYLN